jgi:hypothetical protein
MYSGNLRNSGTSAGIKCPCMYYFCDFCGNFPIRGIREGTFFTYENMELHLGGSYPAKIFRANTSPYELNSTDSFTFLLK